MTVALAVLALLVGVPGALAAGHLTLLAVASLFYRQPRPAGPVPRQRFLVLIPAHNEQDVISRTLSAIYQSGQEGVAVLVIADRCTDETATIARAFGSIVLERPDGSLPGRAATRQAGIELALTLPDWDVMVMIDADSLIERDFFDTCEGMLATGARALQVRSEALPSTGFFGQAGVAAFALQGILIPRGRDRLGLSVRLKGSGLVVLRDIVERHTFRGPGASEDLWFSLDLCGEGILPRHIDSTRLRSETARSLKSASVQRLRWETGRLLAAREFVRPLLRRRDAASLEAVVHLVTPPLAVAILSLVFSAGLLLTAGLLVPALVPVALLLAIAGDVVIGLVQARASAATWGALLTAPVYVVWKAWVQLRAIFKLMRHQQAFEPTPRD